MPSKLVPDATRVENGVTIYEKIIPDSAIFTGKAGNGVYPGDTVKPCKDLLPIGVTIHNTSSSADAETYTRATWPNCNMSGVTVHYYVDDECAWQNLRENERGLHAQGGNGKTIGIECIMGSATAESDLKARDNAARLIASILHRYMWTIDNLYTHNYWMGYADEIVPNAKKNCPYYLLATKSNPNRYKDFKNLVKKYLDALGPARTTALIAGPTVDGQSSNSSILSNVAPEDILCPGDFASPYLITLDRKSKLPDWKPLHEMGVAGAIVEGGYLFDITHTKQTKFRSPKFNEQIKWCKENEVNVGLLWTARARNRQEAEEEADRLYFLTLDSAITVGLWLKLELTSNKVINDGILETYYSKLSTFGFSRKLGIKTTDAMLKLISWEDKWHTKFALWIDDPFENIEDLDDLMRPSHFDIQTRG